MFLVIFRNRKRADLDEAIYAQTAQNMENLAKIQPGFLSFKTYTSDDGEVVALSEWESEGAALSWRRQDQHRAAQEQGRQAFYDSYTLFACDNPRVHQFSREDKA